MDSPLVRKIKALINKANSAKEIGSLEEAEAFAAKALELCIKHGISIEELSTRIENLGDQDFIIEDTVYLTYHCPKAGYLWKSLLHGILTKAFGCASIVRRREKQLVTVGKKDKIEVVLFLFSQLCVTFMKLADTYFLEMPAEKLLFNTKKDILQSYLIGVCYGVYNKLSRCTDEYIAEVEEQTQGYGLMKYGQLIKLEQEALDRFIKENMNPKNPRKFQAPEIDAEAFYLGTLDGLEVDIHKGLN